MGRGGVRGLWKDSFPLPDAIIEEIKRVADRVEIRFEDASPDEVPAAALAESPIYRGGEQLQPWQRSFVTMFLKHRETYGKARLLLADEVGLGKDAVAGRQRDGFRVARRWPGADSLSVDADTSVAGRTEGQARYSQRCLALNKEGMAGSHTATSSRPVVRKTSSVVRSESLSFQRV